LFSNICIRYNEDDDDDDDNSIIIIIIIIILATNLLFEGHSAISGLSYFKFVQWDFGYCGHYWPIVPAPGDGDCGEIGGMKFGRGNRSTRENLPQRHFVHDKSHMTIPGFEPGPPRWEASD
jgi:hypothetical protein